MSDPKLGMVEEVEVTISNTEWKECIFEYLNDLWNSGVTNMFGAAPYIQREFNVTREEARELLIEWMAQF